MKSPQIWFMFALCITMLFVTGCNSAYLDFWKHQRKVKDALKEEPGVNLVRILAPEEFNINKTTNGNKCKGTQK